MMSGKISVICALLLMGTLLSACGDTKPAEKPKESDSDKETAAPSETGTAADERIILDALPEDTDLENREIRIRINEFDQTQYGANIFMQGPDKDDADAVNTAILERNRAVEERLNVSFRYDIVSDTYDKVYGELSSLVMAGDDLYDLIIDQQYGMLRLATGNLLYNLNESEYNDFTQPYWWGAYMDELRLGGDDLYIAAGDYFLDIAETSSAIFFNKTLYESDYESCSELYQLAFDGKWTIDRLGQYIKEYYKDLNSDGTVSRGDRMSMNFSRNFMDALCFGSGIDYAKRDENGYQKPDLGQEAITDLLQTINDNFFLPKTTYDYRYADGATEAESIQNQRMDFAGRGMLFLNDYLGAVKDLRDMKDDYGILPVPKMDENVKNYRSIVHDTALVGGIPTTCADTDSVCITMEALCSMSHNTSMKAYFETALKTKYARDEESSKMIDLLHDSIMTSFMYAYGSLLGDYHNMMRTFYDNKSADYMTVYGAAEKAFDKRYKKFIDDYLALKEQ